MGSKETSVKPTLYLHKVPSGSRGLDKLRKHLKREESRVYDSKAFEAHIRREAGR